MDIKDDTRYDRFRSAGRVPLTKEEITDIVFNKKASSFIKYILYRGEESFQPIVVSFLAYRKLEDNKDIEACFVSEDTKDQNDNRTFYYPKMSEYGSCWFLVR